MARKTRVIAVWPALILALVVVASSCAPAPECKVADYVRKAARVLYLDQADPVNRNAPAAVKAYAQAIQRCPTDPLAHYELALVQMLDGNLTAARESWNAYLRVAAKSPAEADRRKRAKAYLGTIDNLSAGAEALALGEALVKSDELQKGLEVLSSAIVRYEQALQLPIDEARPKWGFADINRRLGEAFVLRALCRAWPKSYAEARADLERARWEQEEALRASPDLPLALYALAQTQTMLVQYASALEKWQAYRKTVPAPKTDDEHARDQTAAENIQWLEPLVAALRKREDLEQELQARYKQIQFLDEAIRFWEQARIEVETTGKISEGLKTRAKTILAAAGVLKNARSIAKPTEKYLKTLGMGEGLDDRIARGFAKACMIQVGTGLQWCFDTIIENVLADPVDLAVGAIELVAYKVGLPVGEIRTTLDLTEIDIQLTNLRVDRGLIQWDIGQLKQQLDRVRKLVVPLPLHTTLDPNRAGTWSERFVAGQLFEGLVRYAATGELVPAGAETWEVSADNRVFTFHLREDAFWSDGLPVTAEDYVYGLRRQLDPQVDGGAGYLLSPIHGSASPGSAGFGARAIDSHTLEIITDGPAPYLPAVLALAPGYPIPAHVVEQYGTEWARPPTLVSNGPFVAAEWTGDTELILVRNPDYWNAAEVRPDAIVVTVVADEQAAAAMFVAGQADLAPGPIDPRGSAAALIKPRYAPANHTVFLAFNVDRPALDDTHVRKALASAVNRDELVQRLGDPAMTPATGLVPPALAVSRGELRALPWDPEQARRELGDAALSPERLGPVTLLARIEQAALVDEIAADWRAVLGLAVAPRLVNGPEYRLLRNRCAEAREQCEYDAIVLDWEMQFGDPYDMLQGWRSFGWQDDRYAGLIASALTEPDSGRRAALYNEAEKQVTAGEAIIVPLYHYGLSYLARPEVVGPWSAFGVPDLGQWRTTKG